MNDAIQSMSLSGIGIGIGIGDPNYRVHAGGGKHQKRLVLRVSGPEGYPAEVELPYGHLKDRFYFHDHHLFIKA